MNDKCKNSNNFIDDINVLIDKMNKDKQNEVIILPNNKIKINFELNIEHEVQKRFEISCKGKQFNIEKTFFHISVYVFRNEINPNFSFINFDIKNIFIPYLKSNDKKVLLNFLYLILLIILTFISKNNYKQNTLYLSKNVYELFTQIIKIYNKKDFEKTDMIFNNITKYKKKITLEKCQQMIKEIFNKNQEDELLKICIDNFPYIPIYRKFNKFTSNNFGRCII